MRDTRGAQLSAADRFNHFSAAPFCAVSIFFEGNARQITTREELAQPQRARLFPAPAFAGPQSAPQTSWNDGDIHAILIVLFPEAVAALTGLDMSRCLDRVFALSDPEVAPLAAICAPACAADCPEKAFDILQDQLEPLWRRVRGQSSPFGARLSDWTHALATRAAISHPGRSLRQMQRRVRALVGQPLRRLGGFEKSDAAFEIALQDKARGTVDMAGIAAEAGFADQSHMGRVVRAQTGFSPAELMARIESDEAFWSFRLMGARF